jgi:hypothetical protein
MNAADSYFEDLLMRVVEGVATKTSSPRLPRFCGGPRAAAALRSGNEASCPSLVSGRKPRMFRRLSADEEPPLGGTAGGKPSTRLRRSF